MSDNLVSIPGRPRSSRRRGVALISVIAVLVLLAMVATPFLLTMRDSAARGERFLYGVRAEAEAEALFDVVRSHLAANLEHVERRRLDSLGEGAAATAQKPLPDDATPTCDEPAEIALPPDVLARFNQATAKEHRVWSARIVDAQTLFNLNTCSYPVLANILGRTEVAASVAFDKETIPLTSVPATFPEKDGVVRIGGECIRYERILGNDLVGCQRGYMADAPGNGRAHDLELGATVIPEACFQIATRPFRVRAGKDGRTVWVRTTHVNQARTIGELGVTTLPPALFDRLRPHVTAWNGNAVGDGWCNPQTVRNAITASDPASLYARVKNVRYLGPGTMVRITDGTNEDFAVVTDVRGGNEVSLAGRIGHDYAADQTRIYGLARSPVNVNTAAADTLALVFDGLQLRGKTAKVTERQARELAAFLKAWKRPATQATETAPALPEGEPGVYRAWDDLTTGLEAARDAGKLNDDDFEAVLRNAMNANDAGLAFSTVPFVFRSYDVYEVRAAVSIQGASGRELARREIRRVMEVGSTRSGTFVVETQEDFQNQVMKSRDGKWMATYPKNVNAHYDSVNVPASEYQAYANRQFFPSTDRSSGVGDVRSLPASFRYTLGAGFVDPVRHFDEQESPDGLDLSEKALELSVEGPYEPQKGKLDVVDEIDIEGVAEDVQLGLREFACSFWYRPAWERDGKEHVIFDYGLDTDFMDRVSLRYDPEGDGALVLACSDATRERRAAEIRYRFDHTTWKADQWYHIACQVHGCDPALMQLFVDGEQQGRPATLTRLTAEVPGTGEVTELNVEDARDFPDSGVLLVRGREGIELMEYSAHTESSFTITRRKARSMRHEPEGAETVSRAHLEGDGVELYGFSGPLFTDVRKGGASLSGSLGPWRVYRFLYEGDALLQTTQNGTLQVCLGLGQPSGSSQAVAGCALADWDTGSTDSSLVADLGSTGTVGIAMLVSSAAGFTTPGATYSVAAPSPQGSGPTGGPFGAPGGTPQSGEIGGVEFVLYQVSATAGAVDIIQRNVALKHMTSDALGFDGRPRFFPSHEFGETAPNNQHSYGQATAPGALTAFVPIAILGTGTGADYLDPLDAEPQLRSALTPTNGRDASLRDGHAYVQVDGEWIAYDTFDDEVTPGRVAFYRDQRVDDAAELIGGNRNLKTVAPVPVASGLPGGGESGNSSDDPPPHAEPVNLESEAPEEASGSGVQPAFNGKTVTSLTFAQALDFRGYEKRSVDWEHRIANTIPADHAAGAEIVPAFLVLPGNTLEATNVENPGERFAYPGFDDLVTLRDRAGNDEQIRVQWGYMGWCAPTAFPTQTWRWDRPQGPDGDTALRRYDSRAFTRALKFPSGEMPDNALTDAKPVIRFGRGYDDAADATPGTVDEVVFWRFSRAPKDRPDYTRLGKVPPEVADPQASQGGGAATPPPQFVGIDDEADEFEVHLTLVDDTGSFAAESEIHEDTYPDDGGVVQIDDELILYGDFDPAARKFTDCRRGAFGTEPAAHGYGARVVPIHSFPSSRVETGIDESAADYELADTTDFPDDGYLRVGLGTEIIGYTAWAQKHLTAPLGRIDTEDGRKPRRGGEDKRSGGSIFRGRYGTTPEASDAGEVAIAMPFRVYDRYAERADDPEQSYLQLSWTKHGAIWKRVTWDQLPKQNVQVVALLRFSGGPPWDSEKVIRVGQEGMPQDDRRLYLYEITDPTAENLLNVEADRLEVRLAIRYAKGAYDRIADVMPDNWKETPHVRKVVVEYVAPPQVLSQE